MSEILITSNVSLTNNTVKDYKIELTSKQKAKLDISENEIDSKELIDKVIDFVDESSSGPANYIKSANVNGNTLTLVDQDNQPITFTPSSGGLGSNDYALLSNKPQIGGNILKPGNNSYEALGIQKSEEGKGLSTNDFTTAEKNKLAGISPNANKYVLPTASKTTLGGVKVDGTTITISNGVISANGGGGRGTNDYEELDNKPRINGVELVGNKSASTLGLATDRLVTTSYSGLMSSDDKTKLDSIESNANYYVLPIAGIVGSDRLGGVMVDGTTITIENGVISAAPQPAAVDVTEIGDNDYRLDF